MQPIQVSGPKVDKLKESYISPIAPFTDDFASFKASDVNDVVKQNIIMILLCNPGERIMKPEFGVGLRTYLFEPAIQSTFNRLTNKIREQLSLYAPPIIITALEVSFNNSTLNLKLEYIENHTKAIEKIELSYGPDDEGNPILYTPQNDVSY